jgi:hypothetical protein
MQGLVRDLVGFGWMIMMTPFSKILDGDVFSEFKTHMVSMQARFGTFNAALKTIGDEYRECQDLHCDPPVDVFSE